MKERKVYKCRLKFYANTPKNEINKYFCWEIESIFQLEDRIKHFIRKGYWIKAAYFENINIETGEILENSKVDIQRIINTM